MHAYIRIYMAYIHTYILHTYINTYTDIIHTYILHTYIHTYTDSREKLDLYVALLALLLALLLASLHTCDTIRERIAGSSSTCSSVQVIGNNRLMCGIHRA